MKHKKKKGFTIVELVIVIAIIAILAAVLIPTFSKMIDKAHVSNDIQLVKKLNTALAIERAENDKNNPTAFDAVEVCAKNGYLVNVIVAKSNYDIAWHRGSDTERDGFMLIDTENDTVIFPQIDNQTTYTITEKKEDYFIFRSSIPTKGNDLNYSIFANGISENEVTVNGIGFDAGYQTNFKKVMYINKETDSNPVVSAKDVIIRTNTFETVLYIDAPLDNVSHYGFIAIVNISAIKDSSYDEYGTAGRVEVKQGHVEAMAGCEIFCLAEAEENAGDVKDTTVNEGAIVHKDITNIKDGNGNTGKDCTVTKEADGVGTGHIEDCGPGRHKFSQYVCDSQGIYDICECCGYTLIHIIDASGTELKQSKNTLDSNGVVSTENVTPVKTYQTIAAINTNSLPQTNFEVMSEPIDEPAFITTDEKGETVVVDTKCKHVFTYHDVHYVEPWQDEDICMGICEKCGLKLKTHHDWWIKSQISGQTTYEDTCTKCVEHCVRDESVVQLLDANGKPINVTYTYDGKQITPTNGRYKALPYAFNAIHNGSIKTATIKLINNAQVNVNDWALTVKLGEKITLDLNGYTLAGYGIQSSTTALLANYGELIIKDSTDTNNDGTGKGLMTFYAENADPTKIPSYASNLITNKGYLLIQSGSLNNASVLSKEVAASGGAAFAIDNQSGEGDISLIINGGKITAACSMSIRQYAMNSTYDNYVEINGGVIGSYWLQENVVGGTNGNKYDTSIPYKATCVINGGTFLNNVAFGYYSANTMSNLHVTINGGTFKSDIFDVENTKLPIVINDGVFGCDVSAYCKDGYMAKLQNNSSYCIVPISKEDALATIEISKDQYRYYRSLEKAFDAVENNQIIKLEDDYTIFSEITLNKNKNITLDLNGYTLTRDGYYMFYIDNGSLTLSSSRTGGQISHVNAYTSFYLRDGSTGSIIYNDIDSTMSSGAYNVGIIYVKSVYSNVTINSGSLNVVSGNRSLFAYDANNIYINGGTFNGRITVYPVGDTIISDGVFNGDITIKMYGTGDTIINNGEFNSDTYLYSDSNIFVYDGLFNAHIYAETQDQSESVTALCGGTYKDFSKKAEYEYGDYFEVLGYYVRYYDSPYYSWAYYTSSGWKLYDMASFVSEYGYDISYEDNMQVVVCDYSKTLKKYINSSFDMKLINGYYIISAKE